jgi:hypothetical protein
VSTNTAHDHVGSANQLARLIVCFSEHISASRRYFRRKARLWSYSPEERSNLGVSSAAGYGPVLISHSGNEGQARVRRFANSQDSTNSSAEISQYKRRGCVREAELAGNGPRRAPCLESDPTDSLGGQQKITAPNRGLP